jgi:polyisoprenoid-binding protein YceI
MMNKRNIIILVLVFFLTGFLVFGEWGDPKSKLEKTKINETNQADFSSILGTSWVNNKNDSSSSEISFYVDGLKNTKGFFEDFDIIFKVSDNDPEKAKLKVSINVNSINTDNIVRDKAIMDEDFFNAEKFPTIEFYSKKIKKVDSTFISKGLINMMGQSKELSFSFKHSGITNNKKGSKVAIFEGDLEIDRTSLGMDHIASVGDIVGVQFYCELIEAKK